MTTIWTLCCAFVALVVELVAGYYGLVLPAFPVTVFYFTVVRGWRRTAAPFLVLGSVLDLAFGRSAPVETLAVPAVQAFAMFWRRHADCRPRAVQVVPGLVAGLVTGGLMALLLVLPGAGAGESLLAETVLLLAEAALGAAGLLPVVCAVLDGAAEQMVFDTYRQVREGR